MHGVIHAEIKKFVETTHGVPTWELVLKEAGLSDKIYMAISSYPDEEALAIVAAAAKLTNTSVEAVLEDFGNFIVPDLIQMYRALIDPMWKTLDFLLNTEKTIHNVVRKQNKDAKPPLLQFTKTGPNSLKFIYSSPRQMPALAKGIIRGVAEHYNETVNISSHRMANGNTEMLIVVG